jgi:hypothetical protein
MVKSYSDNIEKDFYLKEISRFLEIKESLVYDAFNKIRFKSIKTTSNSSLLKGEIDQNSFFFKEGQNQNSPFNKRGQRGVSSTDLVISYCLFDEKNINFIKEKILFPDLI